MFPDTSNTTAALRSMSRRRLEYLRETRCLIIIVFLDIIIINHHCCPISERQGAPTLPPPFSLSPLPFSILSTSTIESLLFYLRETRCPLSPFVTIAFLDIIIIQHRVTVVLSQRDKVPLSPSHHHCLHPHHHWHHHQPISEKQVAPFSS